VSTTKEVNVQVTSRVPGICKQHVLHRLMSTTCDSLSSSNLAEAAAVTASHKIWWWAESGRYLQAAYPLPCCAQPHRPGRQVYQDLSQDQTKRTGGN
jgi:hypothetical protein